MKTDDFDICIVGSGAGAGPIIYELSKAGYKVVVLEKGPWFRTDDFAKDELVATRRSVYTPNLKDERHVLEEKNTQGKWIAKSTYSTGNDFWNGNCVGGSSNFMSGYFSRLKPDDFKLLSKYGAIKGANIVDWPITYDALEPYYEKVERIVGVSGKVVPHKFLEPRSTDDFPYPPLKENIVSSWIDSAAKSLNIKAIPMARAILSKAEGDRNACYYSNYCGSYGCSSDAKGSSRVSLIHKALKTGNCTVIPNAKVFYLDSSRDTVSKAFYYDVNSNKKFVKAKIFVIAAQAVETSRLLLMSKNDFFPNGLANNNGQVGKNIIFSSGGVGGGEFLLDELDKKSADKLKEPGVFVNRTLHDFYEITDPKTKKIIKGGSIDFLLEHANPVSKAIRQKWDDYGDLLYGASLKQKLKNYFTNIIKLKFEIFVDWLPTDDCYVTLDETVKDKWGDPVAKIRLFNHKHDRTVSRILGEKAKQILDNMGTKNTYVSIGSAPPSNLQAGGCRFGNNPKTSVLNSDCRAHEVTNLYVTDGSFMPTGGSVTYTWTIYANSFRVADHIINRLKKS
jgi:choline dehydrogenase-like flavoprotein